MPWAEATCLSSVLSTQKVSLNCAAFRAMFLVVLIRAPGRKGESMENVDHLGKEVKGRPYLGGKKYDPGQFGL